MIIVVAALKGGVGKTTTSVYLSALAAARRPSTLVDSDPQASAADWIEAAEDEYLERVTLVEAPTDRLLVKALDRIDGEEVAVVDTPPGNERLLAKAMERADVVVVPTRIGGVETARVEAVLDLVPRKTPVGLVISSARTYTRDYQDVVAAWTEANVDGVGNDPGARLDRRGPRRIALGRRHRRVPRGVAPRPARRARVARARSTVPDVDADADLARYYDQEAEAGARVRRPIDPTRVACRDAFVAQLRAEGRSTMLEVGTGPGRDAVAFVEADTRVVGVDLSAANALPRATNGIQAVVASIYALPFDDAACDAGWTMSTLVHVPNASIDGAMKELCRVIRPGGPLAIGLWGAPADTEGVNPDDTIVPKRFFSRRTDARVHTLLAPYGRIEQFTTWQPATDDWPYQFVVLRTNE